MNEGRYIGVLLLNMGGPDSLSAVRPFLYNLFSDRMIIKLGPFFMQKPLARLISTIRAPKARRAYALIGGASPLNSLTWAQAGALEEALNARAEGDFKVFVGMNYWHPFTHEAIAQADAMGIRRLVVLSMYPHYSLATTASSLYRLRDAIAAYRMQYEVIPHWYRHPLYIEAMADIIRRGMASFDDAGEVFVLFSAHGLPVKFIERGDLYVEHIRGTINALKGKLSMKCALSFQSRTGPVKWLEPYTDEMLRELSRHGVKNVLIVPISFVSDHIETLYEIDILYKNLAEGLGLNLKRAEALNTHPLLIEAFKELVITKKKECGW